LHQKLDSQLSVAKFEILSRDAFDLDTLHLYLHTDIDECSNNTGGCDQICDNTEGSFQCHCHKGFALSDDNITCQGFFCFVNTLLTFLLVCIFHPVGNASEVGNGVPSRPITL